MSSLMIGNFDGVHRGHLALLDRSRNCAGDGEVTVVTFQPHPSAILRPDKKVECLRPFKTRRELLHAAGADTVIELPSTRELLDLSATDFVDMLLKRCTFDVMVEGADFRFGRDRAGGVSDLIELGKTRDFSVEIVDDVDVELEDRTMVPVRSTLIRWLLRHGRVVDAERALGRPHRIQGTVVQGDQRGRTLGYPTANLDHGECLLPGDGIYSGIASLPDGARVPTAISVGTKPTFGGTERVCEAHVLDLKAPLDDYGWELELEFKRYLHEQLTFESVEPLLKRMSRDCDLVRHHAREFLPS
jgi:riboflavin kinase/FMN adenylyltransferase